MTEPDSEELLDALPDNPCGEEAYQQVLGQSESVEQAKVTSYMGGYFDAEGCINSGISSEKSAAPNHKLTPAVQVSAATSQMAGLFDGEGCIRVAVSKDESLQTGYKHTPAVMAKQNQQGTILERVFDTYCSYYDVKYATDGEREPRPNRQPAVCCRVYSAKDIRNFLAPLLPVLWEKRRQAAIMLREILPRYENGVHLTKSGFIEMMRWKRELDREKPMSDEDRKYTVEYFEELWDDDLDAQQQLGDFQTEEPERVRLSDD
jgi:DNA-dependent RNA polymerase auxiliary subunit epsilon